MQSLYKNLHKNLYKNLHNLGPEQDLTSEPSLSVLEKIKNFTHVCLIEFINVCLSQTISVEGRWKLSDTHKTLDHKEYNPIFFSDIDFHKICKTILNFLYYYWTLKLIGNICARYIQRLYLFLLFLFWTWRAITVLKLQELLWPLVFYVNRLSV